MQFFPSNLPRPYLRNANVSTWLVNMSLGRFRIDFDRLHLCHQTKRFFFTYKTSPYETQSALLFRGPLGLRARLERQFLRHRVHLRQLVHRLFLGRRPPGQRHPLLRWHHVHLPGRRRLLRHQAHRRGRRRMRDVRNLARLQSHLEHRERRTARVHGLLIPCTTAFHTTKVAPLRGRPFFVPPAKPPFGQAVHAKLLSMV